MRVIYFCTSPRPGTHAGGVKVIYDHARALTAMGVEAFILHERRGYRYPWTDQPVPTIADHQLRAGDHLVIPEIKAAALARKLAGSNFRYSIFVQNGYYLSHRDGGMSDADVDFAYRNAERILSISEDTSSLIRLHYPDLSARILRMTCTVDFNRFQQTERKEKLITFMPRKNRDHAEAVVFALKRHLPVDWAIHAIDGLKVSEVADVMRRSRIFLSFSGMEGLGLPPIEAALCGNYVVGYHGGGGKEYWRSPNFDAVDVGDIAGFVAKIVARVDASDKDPRLLELQDGIEALRSMFSRDNEDAHLRMFVRLLETDPPSADTSSNVAIKLQKRMKIGLWARLRRL